MAMIRYRLGTQNLENLKNNTGTYSNPYMKPIALSKIHRHDKLNGYQQKISLQNDVRTPKSKGIIFVWPQRQKLYSKKELAYFAWIAAHLLYWLHVTHILPSGAGLILEQPPWTYEVAESKPENRDYIIEPDWDSIYS